MFRCAFPPLLQTALHLCHALRAAGTRRGTRPGHPDVGVGKPHLADPRDAAQIAAVHHRKEQEDSSEIAYIERSPKRQETLSQMSMGE